MNTSPRRRVSVTALLLGSGPRFARDAVGPVLAFYLCWKLVGLGTAIAVATALSAVAYGWERRRGRPGIGAALGLAITLTQAVVGLTTGSAIAYFVPPSSSTDAGGLAFLGQRRSAGRSRESSRRRRTRSRTRSRAPAPTARVFSTISVVWGVYFLARRGGPPPRAVMAERRPVHCDQHRDGHPVHRRSHELVDLVRRARLPSERRVGVGARRRAGLKDGRA